MAVYINEHYIDKKDIGLINNTALLGAYKWACDTEQDIYLEFVSNYEYDGIVLATHYVENRAIVNCNLMAHIWYYNPEYINGTPDFKYICHLIKKYGTNENIDNILKQKAKDIDFTAKLKADDGRYMIDCPPQILPYIKALNFHDYKFPPKEHLIDFETGEYLWLPSAEIEDIENSQLVKHLSWKTIIEMLPYDDCEFSYGKCMAMFELSKKYKTPLNTFLHNAGGVEYVYLGYLRLWENGHKNRQIKNDILNIIDNNSGYNFDDNDYHITINLTRFFIYGVLFMIGIYVAYFIIIALVVPIVLAVTGYWD